MNLLSSAHPVCERYGSSALLLDVMYSEAIILLTHTAIELPQRRFGALCFRLESLRSTTVTFDPTALRRHTLQSQMLTVVRRTLHIAADA